MEHEPESSSQKSEVGKHGSNSPPRGSATAGTEGITFAGFLLAAVSSWQMLVRLVALVCAAVFAAWLTLLLGAWTLGKLRPPITVRPTETGLEFAVKSPLFPEERVDYTLILVSPNGSAVDGRCSPWVNTELRVSKGHEYTVHASGRVCLAMHRMIEVGLEKETLPPVPWSGPEGIDTTDGSCPPVDRRQKEIERAPYKLAPNLPQGMLVGTITAPGRSPDNALAAGDPQSAQEGEVFRIGRQATFRPTSDGVLWLTVNDIWLADKVDRVPMSANDRAFYRSNVYWNAWFDDNAGQFLVTIQHKEPRRPFWLPRTD